MFTCPCSEKLPSALAVDLAALVDCADGSIVSRTLAEGESGSLTLFAFDAGQRLSEHSAPFDALVQVLDGEAELRIGGKLVRARQGQLVLMPANVPHAVAARTKLKMLLTMFRSA